MKGKMKKLVALALATIMVLAMGITAFAAPGDSTAPTIKISNSAKGETYKVYKIFDATRNANGHMAFKLMTGKSETGLPTGFEVSDSGYVTKAPATLNKDAVEALIAYVGLTWNAADNAYSGVEPNYTGEGNGSELTITLNENDYGYYLVVSSTGAVVSLDDTAPTAEIVDKNASEPSVPSDAKTVNDNDVYIGQTVEYTLKFKTTNYVSAGAEQGDAPSAVDPKQVEKYIITDTLPVGVTMGQVTSITVNGSPLTVLDGETEPTFENGRMEIPWLDADGNSRYANEAELVITYEVTVNENISLGDAEANTNEVALSWKYVDEDDEDGGDDGYKAEVTIATYAIVIQKVDENGHNLAGATFTIDGYSVSGSKGQYKIVAKNPEGQENVASIPMECDAQGKLVIYGLAKTVGGEEDNAADSLNYTIREYSAPDGYNKLEGPETVQATKIATTVTTTYYDENGNVVAEDAENVSYSISEGDNVTKKIENNSGVVLPSTGGIGTTIFYVVGGILVVCAGVLLITKKRMSKHN